MDFERGTVEQQLLAHAERQSSALETIRGYLFYLLLIVVIGLVVGLIVGLSSATGL